MSHAPRALDVDVVVTDDAEAAAATAAERLAHVARAGGHIALSGGSTPRRAYRRAARLAPDWRNVVLWWADERCVPPDDRRSNYGLVRASLLDGLAALPGQVHRIRGEKPPAEAADAYDTELAGVTLDLVLLGVGPDGHTASLFPNAPALEARERRAVATEAGLEPFVARVTLTVPVLAAAWDVVYLVTGEDKAHAVRRAFADPPSPETPASLVRGVATTAILDRAATSELRP